MYNRIDSARLQRNLDVYYPTVRSEIRTYTLQNLHSTFEAKDVLNGRVPDCVVVGIVYQDAFSGKYGYNPFIFKKIITKLVCQILLQTADNISSFTCFNDALQSFLKSIHCQTALSDIEINELKKLLLTAGPQQMIVSKSQRLISQFLTPK